MALEKISDLSFNRLSGNKKSSENFLDDLKGVLPDDLITKAKSFAENSSGGATKQSAFSSKWLGDSISTFDTLILAKNKIMQGSRDDTEKLRYAGKYENSHLNFLLESFEKSLQTDLPESHKSTDEIVKDFIGRELFKNLMAENLEVSRFGKILQAAIDLRGIMFLAIYQSPGRDLSKDQIQVIITLF